MIGEKLGIEDVILQLNQDLIKKASTVAMKAHHHHHHHQQQHQQPYILERNQSSKDVVFAFSGSWSVNDWYKSQPFGITKINTFLFPSIKSIGTDEIALVNEAFSCRFEELLCKSLLVKEVEKSVSEKKQIVFTGHLSGGPIAILATIWFLEKYKKQRRFNSNPPLCFTFGSPLTGDRIFSHALIRENWSSCFHHFIARYDIVPRIMLAPLSSIQPGLIQLEPYMNNQTESQSFRYEPNVAMSFFMMVMRNASCVTSHAACNLMGCTNLMLETASNFIELSPYRPFGNYIFCDGNGRFVAVDNPDAVLQMLFYSAQFSSEAEIEQVVKKSLTAHSSYEIELQGFFDVRKNVVFLKSLVDFPLSYATCTSNEDAILNSALNDLGLSTKARLCLRAAGEKERQKMKNQEKIDTNKECIKEGLNKIQEYKTNCDARKLGYYDAFKLQKDIKDFNTNVKRLELAGIWDEIVEMLQRHELPDGFEGLKEWIELGTRYRSLVEPLDIANYYRHLKNEDTGPYNLRARPKRYRFTQRWLEHDENVSVGRRGESCFWAEVEEVKDNGFENVKDRIMGLEQELVRWIKEGKINNDVFFHQSTFSMWWKTLPLTYRSQSCIAAYIAK